MTYEPPLQGLVSACQLLPGMRPASAWRPTRIC